MILSMILDVLLLLGYVLFCFLLIIVAVLFMPKLKGVPPRYDFSNNDKIERLK